jgi:hypothetical protein
MLSCKTRPYKKNQFANVINFPSHYLENCKTRLYKKINSPTASWNSRVCACCQGKAERIGGEQLRDNSIFLA